MTCTQCHTQNKAGRKFCATCGQRLPHTCAQCGFLNDPDDRFCGGCGTPLATLPRADANSSAVPTAAQSPAVYTPRHLAERIRAEHAALEARRLADGERKTVTALFADLKGSTALIEGLDPEEARAIMATKIFVNLPVKNLLQSVEFFTKLGFTFNPQFTDETATCMIVSEDILVMLLTHDKFKTFTPKPIYDATKSIEVLTCLSLESRDQVNTMVRKAVAAGGTIDNDPQDHGFMYGYGFQDLDGHIWKLIYMESSAIHES